ncbi:2-dehydro-3-deoxyphosphogluconate aldolase/(4S)-4-hydroxy-2-oxoglutarate aldolase [Arthrobacter sp. JUb119]|uniref:bifunctional 4-hydroxy-2-oxoglutarate aldolase/2-dehydro-3-deoxy-phosphogluconate aldolase n=1 Tax=Arthrobacter sp. JUb115 TaxID=2485108 RepID=UPI00105B519A|nr:bifunctional 4-hydroxy-2-oxoglutarate aldolase/2-dehydro-3-deoxy-phosphogluconate aldolase [Arthrobacter sp. JUb115]MCS3494524.1 2-dehydro-3-deoxyphosphogluconate aldolase/(4S)-4-hydroxy-2-oxoglutarate aldolase [Arthrobacter sp. JUb119]TDU22614.1 2-dehydro-3-deoxyphosphogluconate aldolase/(4S)-4-hydroxy-2-oxoglutarate aldolase [Arthrobacter sp. JUb115]
MSQNTKFARPVSPRLQSAPVIAVLRAEHARDYAPVIEALIAGGIVSVELTLSTPGVIEELPVLRRQFGNSIDLGVGTVTALSEVDPLIDAGADYLVTPTTRPGIIDRAVSRGVPIFPGGLTPSELHDGWTLGASAVKVFPACVFGPSYISHLRGPFPEIQVVPSGGVSLESAVQWMRAGALAVSLGGPLLLDAFKGGDLKSLSERSVRVVEQVKEFSAS